MKYKVGVAGVALSGLWVVLHVAGVGGRHFQVWGYLLSSPVLSAFPAYLFWQVARRSAGRAGSFWRWSTAAWVVMTAAALCETVGTLLTGNILYPSMAPAVELLDLATVVLVLVGLLRVQVRTRWAVSKLRLGLDMVTVLLAALIFLGYFVVAPGFAAADGGIALVAILVQPAGLLVLIFAVARLMLAGAAAFSRAALLVGAAAGVAAVLMGVLQYSLTGSALRFALASWALTCLLLTVSPLLQMRTSATTAPAARDARKPSSMLPYAAIAAVFALVVLVLRGHGLSAHTWSVLAGAIVLTVLVVVRQIVAMRDNTRLLVRLDHSLAALRHALRREQVLGDLGSALLKTTDADGVHRLALRAVGQLLEKFPAARAELITVAPDDPDTALVMTAGGARADPVRGVRMPVAAIPTGLLARLAGGELVTARGAAALGMTGAAGDDRPLTLLPLLNGERFFGVLSVSADEELPADLLKSLQGLRTQVSLALESVALTEKLTMQAEKLTMQAEELTMQAMHDPLTGLGNRTLLRERLTAAVVRARRSERPVAVLLLDLNGFKPINDTYGHDVGDELLKVVADRLRQSARAEDTVARLGGDEFVVIAEDLDSVQGAIAVAERVVDALDRVVPVAGNLLRTPASIGIALSHVGTIGPDDLLRDADTAMYRAKRAGGGRYRVYEVPARPA